MTERFFCSETARDRRNRLLWHCVPREDLDAPRVSGSMAIERDLKAVLFPDPVKEATSRIFCISTAGSSPGLYPAIASTLRQDAMLHRELDGDIAVHSAT